MTTYSLLTGATLNRAFNALQHAEAGTRGSVAATLREAIDLVGTAADLVEAGAQPYHGDPDAPAVAPVLKAAMSELVDVMTESGSRDVVFRCTKVYAKLGALVDALMRGMA